MPAYNYITNTGVLVPDTADTLEEVKQEWKNALGRQDLITTPDTPQGVLITQETIARQGVILNNAQLANQINPNLASGVFLDAICAFLGLERRKGSKTLVRAVTLRGIPGTLVYERMRARTAAGDVFILLKSVVLGADGKAEGDFEAVESGAIPCPAHELAYIVDAVLGWETLDNSTSGTMGDSEESDEQLYLRRKVTLARQGISTVEAQISGLYDLPGVKSLQFRENIAATPENIDGIDMLPHSVWACVDGGTDEDVARTLLREKTNGAAWNGAKSVDIMEAYSGQIYTVRFDRPVEKPVMARVTVRENFETDPQTATREAVMSYADGRMSRERGFAVGIPVSPFELSGAINREFPELHVAKVEVAFIGESYQTDELPIAIDEKATITPSSITVVVV